ncbi:MAG: 30S ribosome-binding factor RbfA [Vulcanimicrobiaceae bacterium]
MKRERMGRIDHELQRELARLISTELKDPRLGFTTVTRVEITNDLQKAKVFVSIIGDRHVAKQTMTALESAKGFLRGELGHAVALRHTPELSFVEDRSTEKAIALSKVLAATGGSAAVDVAETDSGETNAERDERAREHQVGVDHG